MSRSLERLLEQVRNDRGIDLTFYKHSFLRRRLETRLRARGCLDYDAYGRVLRQEPEEYTALLEAFSINLTRFFRDESTFRALEERTLPALLEQRSDVRRLSLWSAGCAGGEEPYSLAILLREVLGPDLPRWRLSILAGDRDEKALERARAGRYDAFSFRELSPRYRQWVQRHFTPGPEFQLTEPVRRMVTFARHDLLEDPFPPDLDLILCRNVLIYFEREQQERLYRAFYQALRPDGFFVLGKTEVLPIAWSRHFPVVEIQEHIYRRAVLEAERSSAEGLPAEKRVHG